MKPRSFHHTLLSYLLLLSTIITLQSRAYVSKFHPESPKQNPWKKWAPLRSVKNPSSFSRNTEIGMSDTESSMDEKEEVSVLAVAGLGKMEWSMIGTTIQETFQKKELKLNWLNAQRYRPLTPLKAEDNDDCPMYGTTGRVIILQAKSSERLSECIKECKEKILEILENQDMAQIRPIHQEIYFHCQTEPKVERYQIIKAMMREAENKAVWKRFFTSTEISKEAEEERFLPSKVYKINLNMIDRPNRPEETQNQKERGVGVLEYPDWGTVGIFDNLVTEKLRASLLSVILGPNASNWDDNAKGPDPSRWTQGGVSDFGMALPTKEWGMAGIELYEILTSHQNGAVGEIESLIGRLFCDYHVARMPLDDFLCTPINVNAPTRHDGPFMPHFDSNPLMMAGGTTFSSLYGKYNNRTPGRPMFLSVLVYLSDEWKSDVWGAPTSFHHITTNGLQKTHNVEAKPCRVIIMDSDMWHSVNAPNALAGERPRYSMVWRLMLFPKKELQDMRNLQCHRPWPTPEII